MTKYIAMFDEFIQELQESIRSAKAKQQGMYLVSNYQEIHLILLSVALQDQKMEF